MGRKYRQQGYQDDGTDSNRGREQKQSKRPREGSRSGSDGPRSPRMPGFQELMRCAMCGHIISATTEIRPDSQCPKCQADLRSCKHCRHFDTGARLECTQPILKRIMAKDQRNECEFFDSRTSVERQTTSPNGRGTATPANPKDARSAFDDLFR